MRKKQTRRKRITQGYKTIGTITILTIGRMDGRCFDFKIDTADLDEVSKIRWYVMFRGDDTGVYAFSYGSSKNSPKRPMRTYLHSFIAGKAPSGSEVDHIDRDTQNNTRKNLRIVKLRINRINRKITNKHGFPGIYFIPDDCPASAGCANPWRARIRKMQPNGKTRNYHIGVFPTKEDAIRARKDAEKKYFGYIFHR